MRKALKISAIVLAAIIALLGIGVLTVQLRGVPSYPAPVIPELKVEVTPERVEHGLKIASMLCIKCHTGSDERLSGKIIADLPAMFGVAYSANITQDPTHGIGSWSDGELAYFIRTGLRKDGTYAPPYMPKYPLMADEDLHSIIAFLRSDDARVQASGIPTQACEPSLFTKFLCNVNPGMKPFPFPEARIERPDTLDIVATGKYLSNNVYGCFACHSENFATNSDLQPELSKGFFGGGNPMPDLEGVIHLSANLTMDKETGLGNWTEAQFIAAVKTGLLPNGKQFAYPMEPYTALTDNEVKAIWAYLQAVPVIQNPKGLGPSKL